jgi:hypothetical protein
VFDEEAKAGGRADILLVCLLMAIGWCALTWDLDDPGVHAESVTTVAVSSTPDLLCGAYCDGRQSPVLSLDPQRHVCVCGDGATYDTAAARPLLPVMTYDLFCDRLGSDPDPYGPRSPTPADLWLTRHARE